MLRNIIKNRRVILLTISAVIALIMVCSCKAPETTLDPVDASLQQIIDDIGPIGTYTVVDPTGSAVIPTYVPITPNFPKILTIDPDEMEKEVISGLTFPYVVPEIGITALLLDSYSGPYIEDGSNEYVNNCAAILLKNDTDKPIEYAEISFIINQDDKEEAVFKVSSLPGNCAAVVLEANKREYKSDDLYMLKERAIHRLESFELNEDKIQVIGEQKAVSIKNLTDKPYAKVIVYYKNLYQDNLYFGGITYTRTFTDVAANGQSTLVAGNYLPDVCSVIRVDAVE